jgi:FkbM family methyltransferase
MSVYINERSVIKTSSFRKDDIFLVLPNETAVSIFDAGIPENSLIRWSIESMIQPGKCFIDIGAHCGTYAISFAKSGKCSHVHAFECQRNTFYSLCGGISLSNVGSIVTAHNYALGSESGTTTLKIISEDGGGSSIKHDLPTHQFPLREETVTVRKLDEFDINNIGLIKIDVEGAELDVIKGSLKTLERNNYPSMMIECWPDDWFRFKKDELFLFLVSLGYKIVPISGYNFMFIAEYIR